MSDQPDKINERVAVVESVITHQKDTLDEITSTLKEVVATQALLAQQRADITRLTETLTSVTKMIHEHEKHLSTLTLRFGEIEKAVVEVTKKQEEASIKTRDNSRFVKNFGVFITAVMVPLVIAVIINYLP
ncbi:MAG: hypothetical protein CMF22_12025 [Idiomarinaceae bacterium]|nr:hypothetical protein [Idiomarinaceae bacterium]|tara:strand:+ start:11911 stop:12303 length:393 start_codon:yes stop_codon:yes gene_type:complete